MAHKLSEKRISQHYKTKPYGIQFLEARKNWIQYWKDVLDTPAEYTKLKFKPGVYKIYNNSISTVHLYCKDSLLILITVGPKQSEFCKIGHDELYIRTEFSQYVYFELDRKTP